MKIVFKVLTSSVGTVALLMGRRSLSRAKELISQGTNSMFLAKDR
jgi:hypothetical protein